jgi:hypothetical protein
MTDEILEKHEPIPKHIQDFIFVRELSEVYLLMDHLSGRWDKKVNEQLVSAVCEIGWPPSGTAIQQAAQAATLLSAKDKLNIAAGPANGATIAFTLLVSGEDNVDRPGRWTSALSWLWGRVTRMLRPQNYVSDAGARDSGADASPVSPLNLRWSEDPPTRLSLARLAYPGLVSRAKSFKWTIRAIIVLLFLWLMLTCFLSWDVAAGRAILLKADAARTLESQYEAEVAKRAAPSQSQGGHSAEFAVRFEKNCHWQRLVDPAATIAENDESFSNDDRRLCEQLAQARLDHAASRQILSGWLADWKSALTGVARILCRHTCLPILQSGVNVPEEQTNDQWGAVLLEVLASSVLPLCYGLLGAGAAVVRDLWSKMKESLLSPRDLTLALGQLALGAVIGACVGLFVSPPSNSSQGAGGLLGSVVLSASALSFIAGFGVEGVFVALESLIKRVFNIPQASKPNQPVNPP